MSRGGWRHGGEWRHGWAGDVRQGIGHTHGCPTISWCVVEGACRRYPCQHTFHTSSPCPHVSAPLAPRNSCSPLGLQEAYLRAAKLEPDNQVCVWGGPSLYGSDNQV
eukprot:49491-Chlamydomonas_euryale.AAC.2